MTTMAAGILTGGHGRAGARETEHTVYALACFMGEDYGGAIGYIGKAMLPIPMRDGEVVRQMERDVADFFVPRLGILQAAFTALASQRHCSPTIQ